MASIRDKIDCIKDHIKIDKENPICSVRNVGAVYEGTVKKNWVETGNALPTLYKDKNVVVKCCFSSDTKQLRKFSEAYARLKQCNHENIVTAFFPGIYKPANGSILMNAFVMEAGEQSLAELLSNKTIPTDKEGSKEGHLTMVQCMSWIKQIANALAYIHTKKIVHRDVKPRNIVMFNNSTIVKLCDFDDSREISSHMTPEVGTGNFMAPEVARLKSKDELRRKYTEKCDCYSFGVTVLAILFQIPDGNAIPEADQEDQETSVARFTTETESCLHDLKASIFDYAVHKEKFETIKKILDKALQADSEQRLSSQLIYSQLEQPEPEAVATTQDPEPMPSDVNKNSSPVIPTIRSTPSRSLTVYYEVKLSENSQFTSEKNNNVLSILRTMGVRVNGKLDRKAPLKTTHDFKLISVPEEPLFIEHNMSSSDGSAQRVEEYCKNEKEHVEWLATLFTDDNDTELRNIQFSVWNPQNVEYED